MIHGFGTMRHVLSDKETGHKTICYCACLRCSSYSDDPISTFEHYMLFPTPEMAKAFADYVAASKKEINWNYWFLVDANSRAEPYSQTATVEREQFNVQH
ncbi:hypothetical protein QMI71_004669 [Salmonella enterica]|nr:hypothetical protein [Salmonella enterica]